MIQRKIAWDECFQELASTIAKRSGCVRAQVGAVIVSKDKRMVWIGYNGPPAGFPNVPSCEGVCPRSNGQITSDHSNCIAIHGEANAIMHSDRNLREGGTIYITRAPCYECSKLIANSGIKRVVARVDPVKDSHLQYDKSLDFLQKSGVIVDINDRREDACV